MKNRWKMLCKNYKKRMFIVSKKKKKTLIINFRISYLLYELNHSVPVCPSVITKT